MWIVVKFMFEISREKSMMAVENVVIAFGHGSIIVQFI